MPKTNGGAGQGASPFQLPANLETLTAEALAELLSDINSRRDAIVAERDPAKLAELTALSEAKTAVVTQRDALVSQQAEIDAQFDEIAAKMADPETPADSAQPAATPAAPASTAPAPAATDAEVVEGEIVDAPNPQLVTASGRPQGGAQTASRDAGGLNPGRRLNPSLTGARALAPAAEAPRAELAITASVGLPGQFGMGDRIEGLRGLGDLAEDRARSMNDQAGFVPTLPGDNAMRHRARRHTDSYGGAKIATIRNNFDTVLSETSSVDAVQAYMDKVNSSRDAQAFESLVAAGGWCATSQIRYDFFNIAMQEGMIDLPTFGVERGGIQYPISPSLADTFSPALPWYTAFTNATVPWLWSEADDILAVTGSPTKPCIRVPCSTMDNKRLECYGICLTAGNLAVNAWPESTANFLRLLMAAHYHASNARYISTIASLAVANAGCTVTGSGMTAPMLATAELGAIDYRAKYGMGPNEVIEWVFPTWSLGAARADLAKRTGVDPSQGFNVSNSDIGAWFSTRNIRAQFVEDYQVRAAGQPGAVTAGGITQYPGTLKGLMYAAGTVARGNGMALDLGVVRDSTLNRTNDFTAAWMEECHLIAKFGHEVREYTINICPDGTTGAADLTSCCP